MLNLVFEVVLDPNCIWAIEQIKIFIEWTWPMQPSMCLLDNVNLILVKYNLHKIHQQLKYCILLDLHRPNIDTDHLDLHWLFVLDDFAGLIVHHLAGFDIVLAEFNY